MRRRPPRERRSRRRTRPRDRGPVLAHQVRRAQPPSRPSSTTTPRAQRRASEWSFPHARPRSSVRPIARTKRTLPATRRMQAARALSKQPRGRGTAGAPAARSVARGSPRGTRARPRPTPAARRCRPRLPSGWPAVPTRTGRPTRGARYWTRTRARAPQ